MRARDLCHCENAARREIDDSTARIGRVHRAQQDQFYGATVGKGIETA